MSCPDQCRCNSRKQVYCNNRNLSKLPDNIPTDTRVLFLQDNQLTNTPELEAKLGKLDKLERLMFYSNQLETIPKLQAPNLRELRLNNNRFPIENKKITILLIFYITIFLESNQSLLIRWNMFQTYQN